MMSARRSVLGLLSTLCVVVGALLLTSAPALASEGCENEARRVEQGAEGLALPDCRAYELVTEGEPNRNEGKQTPFGARASSVGGGIAWFSYYPLSGSLGGEFHNLSIRSKESGWSTVAVGPRLSPASATTSPFCEPAMFFSADLSQGILQDGRDFPLEGVQGSEGCPENDPALVAGEPKDFQDVFVRDSATGSYALANLTPEGVAPGDAWFQDASADFSHVVFEDKAKLTETAPVGASLYEWAAGAVSLLSVLPNGTPTVGVSPGAITESGNANPDVITHPVSADGTRAIFEVEPETEAKRKLFLRENVQQKLESAPGPGAECAKACTVQLDASLGGGGSFLAANTTDTRIFFTDGSGVGQHLYEYATPTGVLSDLTPAGNFGLEGLSGISDNGSYLYVVASAALAGTNATAGQPNLYVFHEGTPGFIATLGNGESSNPAGNEESYDWKPYQLTARVSPSGRYIAFNSIERLTGYDSTPAQPSDCTTFANVPSPCNEIFLYDAARSELQCVSCTPGGAPPTAPTQIPEAVKQNATDGGPKYVPRNVLDDGRVFFDTANALLSGAGNGVTNVYEYEAGGLSLISTGTSEADSFFYDASPSGEDVFFITTQHLVRGDTGNGMRLYDARVGGGIAAQSEALVSPPCEALEVCRSPPTEAPTEFSAASAVLVGSGNLATPQQPVAPEQRQVKKPAKKLTRKQRLARALAACRREKNKHKRAVCTRRAGHLYGKAKS